MKIKFFRYLTFLFFSFGFSQPQVLGKWKTIDEDTGEAKSIVEIYKAEDGLVYGKIIKITNPAKRDKLCTKCEGENKNKKIEGMVMMKNFKKEGNQYIDGEILNPKNGKTYTSKMWLSTDNPNVLVVRGYVGFLYKTVNWERYNP